MATTWVTLDMKEAKFNYELLEAQLNEKKSVKRVIASEIKRDMKELLAQKQVLKRLVSQQDVPRWMKRKMMTAHSDALFPN
jgi:lysozyme family protein